MARLNWQQVTAPNLSGSQQSINAAATLLQQATSGASSALGQFGDQSAIANLARYTDADALNAALRSGQLDASNASAAALGRVMARPSQLLENATSRQSLDYNRAMMPHQVEGAALGNAKTLQGIQQQHVLHPLAVAAKRTANADAQLSYDNRVELQQGETQAADLLRRFTQSGQLATPAGQQAVLAMADQHPNRHVRNAIWGAIGGINPTITSPGYVPNLGDGTNPADLPSATGNSVGDRNNNRGNLVGEGWVTQMPGYRGNDSRGFAIFDNPSQGDAANIQQLERYWEGTQATGGKPTRSLTGIINTWAPVKTGERGNTQAQVDNYIKYVASRTGIDPSAEIPKNALPAVMQAMQEFETGNRVKGTDAQAAVKTNPVANDRAQVVADTARLFTSNPLASQILAAHQSDPDARISEADAVAELSKVFSKMDPKKIAQRLNDVMTSVPGITPAAAIPILKASAGEQGGFWGFGTDYGIDTGRLDSIVTSLTGNNKQGSQNARAVPFQEIVSEAVRQQDFNRTKQAATASQQAVEAEAARLLNSVANLPETDPRRQQMENHASRLLQTAQAQFNAATQTNAGYGNAFEMEQPKPIATTVNGTGTATPSSSPANAPTPSLGSTGSDEMDNLVDALPQAEEVVQRKQSEYMQAERDYRYATSLAGRSNVPAEQVAKIKAVRDRLKGEYELAKKDLNSIHRDARTAKIAPSRAADILNRYN